MNLTQPYVAYRMHDQRTGREKIFTDVTEITRDNIEEIVQASLVVHADNSLRENELIAYERGLQPILDRDKPIRSDINNRIVENNASKIVDVHLGYNFSNPLTLVRREKIDEKGQDERDDDTDSNDIQRNNNSDTNSNRDDEQGESNAVLGNSLGGHTGDADNNNPSDDVAEDKHPGEKKKKDTDEVFTLFNRMLQSRDKERIDVEMAHQMMTTGLGYQMAWPARNDDDFAPFEIMTLDARNTYIVYSNDIYQEPVLGVTYSIKSDGGIKITAYSKKYYFMLERDSSDSYSEPVVLDNVVGEIPIVEFEMTDRMGIFEKVIPIMNALNTINSDRINDVGQHVQSLLWLDNCEIDSDQKEKLIDGDGVIMTKSVEGKNAKIEYLSQTLDQSQVQSLVDYYQNQMLQITSTPSWKESSGGSTTGAVQLSNGWQYLEISAMTIERLFDKPEHQLLGIILKIIKDSPKDYKELEKIRPVDIEVKFNRNKTFDLVSKTNSLVSLLNAGVDGLTAFKTVDLFTDPQGAWAESKKTINGIQSKLSGENDKQSDTTDKTDTSNIQNNQNSLAGIREPAGDNIILDANAAKDTQGKGGANNEARDKTDPSRVQGVRE